MAGTPVEWNVAATARTACQVWANLASVAAGARLTLAADGTPDATANPDAKHLGMTAEGASFLVKGSYEEFFADEISSPIDRGLSGIEAAISANLLQITDMKLAALLLPGVGTFGSGAGYEQVTLGRRDLLYTSLALIFPLKSAVGKFGVFHLYQAANDEGLASEIGNKKLSGTPVAFKGVAIPTRAQIDNVGNYWKSL